MRYEELLRNKVRSVANGKVPGRHPDRTSRGSGDGPPCAICDMPVSPDHLEVDIQFGGGSAVSVATFQVHVQCFAVWDFRGPAAINRRQAASHALQRTERIRKGAKSAARGSERPGL